MQQVRRDDGDGVDVGAFQELPIVGDQIEGMLPRERGGHVVVDVAAGHDRETRAFLEAGDDLFAPPAEPDNADPDHWSCPAAVPGTGACGRVCGKRLSGDSSTGLAKALAHWN